MFGLIDFPTIDFVIKPNEKVKVYKVEFELDEMGKSYYIERGKIKI